MSSVVRALNRGKLVFVCEPEFYHVPSLKWRGLCHNTHWTHHVIVGATHVPTAMKQPWHNECNSPPFLFWWDYELGLVLLRQHGTFQTAANNPKVNAVSSISQQKQMVVSLSPELQRGFEAKEPAAELRPPPLTVLNSDQASSRSSFSLKSISFARELEVGSSVVGSGRVRATVRALACFQSLSWKE